VITLKIFCSPPSERSNYSPAPRFNIAYEDQREPEHVTSSHRCERLHSPRAINSQRGVVIVAHEGEDPAISLLFTSHGARNCGDKRRGMYFFSGVCAMHEHSYLIRRIEGRLIATFFVGEIARGFPRRGKSYSRNGVARMNRGEAKESALASLLALPSRLPFRSFS